MRARTIVLGLTSVVVALSTLALTADPVLLLIGGITAFAALVLAYATIEGTPEGTPWWTSDPDGWQGRPDGWYEDRRTD